MMVGVAFWPNMAGLLYPKIFGIVSEEDSLLHESIFGGEIQVN